ncbi:fibropellin-3-like [Saccostrea cucullata]|uniref:fibropellin-3-like n=1 Tax=Saccostrea cuccullata TaxID=36930 RepID=UPI002ED3427F
MPCQNGASCHNEIGSFYCTCAPGWNSTLCDIDINECDEDPCVYGTCVNTAGSYRCVCKPGLQGQHCNRDKNECLNNTYLCENNGTCVNTVGSFRCNCRYGFTGLTCSFESRKLHADHNVLG